MLAQNDAFRSSPHTDTNTFKYYLREWVFVVVTVILSDGVSAAAINICNNAAWGGKDDGITKQTLHNSTGKHLKWYLRDRFAMTLI